MVRWYWVNFQCRSVLLIWIIVGQGPTTLAIGAGGGCLDTFTFVYHFFLLSPSRGDGPIQIETLSQRAIKPKTTNHYSFVQAYYEFSTVYACPVRPAGPEVINPISCSALSMEF